MFGQKEYLCNKVLCAMTVRIRQVTHISAAEREAFARLLPQLSPRLGALSGERAAVIARAPRTVLLVAETGDGRIVGMLTLVWYDLPSGRRAWVEDVVVDAAARRCGAGEALVREAVSRAAREGVGRLMLTSAPHRTAARALYRKLGFVETETGVFVLKTDTE